MPNQSGNGPEGVTTREYGLNESTPLNPVHCGETPQHGSAGQPETADEIVYSSWRHGVSRKDGDLVMLTDNRVIVNAIENRPALMCAQRKAKKIIPTEEDIIRSNIASFGDDIGKITNRITSMFEIQSKFPEDSKEYITLDYRIKCGELFQQNAIDKAKGIIAKPMPKYWYDRAAIWKDDSMTEEEKEFQSRIVAEKKPYFMRYIYPEVSKTWKKFDSSVRAKSDVVFGRTLDELLTPGAELNRDEQEFVNNYYRYIPVGIGDCVMNKICWRFEKEFDNYMNKYKPGGDFDYSIMKSGAAYSAKSKKAIKEIFEQYKKRVKDYMHKAITERISYDEKMASRQVFVNEFIDEAYSVCSNRYQLCDIILDLTYSKEGSKQFAWDIVPDVIIDNLRSKNGGKIWVPIKDDCGDIMFNGDRFTFAQQDFDWRFE